MQDDEAKKGLEEAAAALVDFRGLAWSELWPKALLSTLSAVVGGVFVLSGQGLTYTSQSRELDLKMVDISLSILSGDRGGVGKDVDSKSAYEEYRLARLFALRALSKYSGVEIPEDEMAQWATSGRIAFGAIPTADTWPAGAMAASVR